MLSNLHLYPVNGAAHRVGKHDTAWNYEAILAEAPANFFRVNQNIKSAL